VDDRGRSFDTQFRASSGNEKGQASLLQLKVLPGARRVTLTFAVQKMRYLEMLVPKVDAGPAGATGK